MQTFPNSKNVDAMRAYMALVLVCDGWGVVGNCMRCAGVFSESASCVRCMLVTMLRSEERCSFDTFNVRLGL